MPIFLFFEEPFWPFKDLSLQKIEFEFLLLRSPLPVRQLAISIYIELLFLMLMFNLASVAEKIARPRFFLS